MLDHLKSNSYRIQSREEFFCRKQRLLAGEVFDDAMWSETFGMAPGPHNALPPGWRDRMNSQKGAAVRVCTCLQKLLIVCRDDHWLFS